MGAAFLFVLTAFLNRSACSPIALPEEVISACNEAVGTCEHERRIHFGFAHWGGTILQASVPGQAIARYGVVGKAFTTVALKNLNAKPTGNQIIP
jgi:hypothetical protein